MNTSVPLRLALLGILALAGAIKLTPYCRICSGILLIISVVMFAAAVIAQLKKRKTIKKIEKHLDEE